MSADRELLELAAKAAGLELWTHADGEWYLPDPRRRWNPLTDDGDALRLAVRLGLWVHIGKYHTAIEGNHIEETARRGDSLAATRRAIVRAAAEIGKAMK